jgi:hypothetical protein
MEFYTLNTTLVVRAISLKKKYVPVPIVTQNSVGEGMLVIPMPGKYTSECYSGLCPENELVNVILVCSVTKMPLPVVKEFPIVS